RAFAEALRAAARLPVRELPRLPPALVDQVLLRAPRPLAEAVADLEAARHPHQAMDAARQVAATIAHLIGIWALAARFGQADGDYDPRVSAALRTLRRDRLRPTEWIALAAALVVPFRRRPTSHPLPALVELFAGAEFGVGEVV